MKDIDQVIDLALFKQACSNCSLQQLCLPVGIDPEDIERLDAIVKRRRPLSRGSYIFHQGDEFCALYVIRSGSVKTYTLTGDGHEQITAFHLPGDLIGLDAINAEQHARNARTLETTSLCEIPFDRLEEVVTVVPNLGRQLLRVMSREIHAGEELLTLLGKRSAEERFAALLLNLSSRFQQRGLSAREFRLSMSRSDIGNYLGLAVETVSRLFTRFQQQRLISLQKSKFICLDVEELQHLANGSGVQGPCAPRA